MAKGAYKERSSHKRQQRLVESVLGDIDCGRCECQRRKNMSNAHAEADGVSVGEK